MEYLIAIIIFIVVVIIISGIKIVPQAQVYVVVNISDTLQSLLYQ